MGKKERKKEKWNCVLEPEKNPPQKKREKLMYEEQFEEPKEERRTLVFFDTSLVFARLLDLKG